MIPVDTPDTGNFLIHRLPTVGRQAQRARWAQRLLTAGVLGLTGLLGLLMINSEPDPSLIGWMIYAACIAAVFYRPRWGVYLLLFFSLFGDPILIPWYPFVKNFSSSESIFYLNDALIFSPMEVLMALTLVSWWGRGLFNRRIRFLSGSLLRPALVFLGFISLGLGYGLLNSGNPTIALWEVRPFFHLVMMIFLSTNLLEKPSHFNHMIWVVVWAIFIESVVGVVYFLTVLGGNLHGVESLTEHAAAIQMNTVYVLFLAAWLFRGSAGKRVGLLLMLPTVVVTYLVSQRRAAFVGLAVACVLLLALLYYQNRRLFWVITPVFAAVGLLYVAAFWNSSGTLGLPVQAIKSVIAPNSVSAADQSSNAYRVLENINTSFTIHQRPLTGVGFGNRFMIVVPMPDISFFAWWDYFPHNSIIYIWVKAGVGAFIAMLYFIGIAIFTGVKCLFQARSAEMKIILTTVVLYLIMHFLFAYVDISWDSQSMLYLGACVGLINAAERVIPQMSLHDGEVKPS